MTVKKAQIDDIGVAYHWDGPIDGPVVMMAHALGTSHRHWDWQIPALADRYRLLRYDWRGHGSTDATADRYTLAQLAADAVALMNALGLEVVDWVGLSAGGMIGQGLGIHHSARLRSLTLCNTASQSDDTYRAFAADRQAMVRRDGMAAVWAMTERLWFTDAFVDAAGDDYQTIRAIYVNTPSTGYLGATAAVADLAYRDQLDRITVPTRIIAAGDHPVTPIARAHEIHDRIVGSRLTVFDGQRHFSNVEAADDFNTALRTGLEKMRSA